MKRFMMLALALSTASGIAAGNKLAAAQLDSEFQLDKAREVAAQWLALLDGGDYASSWSQSDKLFQRGIVQQSWPDAATKLRASSGVWSRASSADGNTRRGSLECPKANTC